ncbi:MAG: DUF1080 domain-containing protein [Planctomycetaceae bacterium]|nr:DUF1080 domain-containing protein [Planctomycetaceae bacterium]
MHSKLLILPALFCLAASVSHAEEKASEWKSMWDGKTFDGWRMNENKESWSIDDGRIVCHGERSHLFYAGEDKPFTDFEFECDVMTTPGSNAGIYFHTRYQDSDWPRYGYECQVNITHRDVKKTGSLYATVDVADPPAKDNEWYKTYIRVKGKHITIKINGVTTVDYEEPEGKPAFSDSFERRLGSGTFALQAHDPDSRVYFRNLRVRRLE